MSSPASSGRLHLPAGPPGSPPLPPGVHPLGDAGLPGPVLAVPPGVAGPVPLLVMLHGAGGSAASVLPMVRDVAAATGALVLAPSSVGSTWDLLTGGLGRDVAALDAALAHVSDRFEVSRVALAGFSDGASYALSLGLANGDLVDALIAFSPGFAAPPSQAGSPRVWLSHGTADTVLPVDRCGRRVVQLLTRAGYDVTYEEFEGGHVVPPELVRAALAWWLEPGAR